MEKRSKLRQSLFKDYDQYIVNFFCATPSLLPFGPPRPPLLQSLTAAVELDDGVGEAVIHNNMGLAYEMLNNLEQAQEHYEKVCIIACYIAGFT